MIPAKLAERLDKEILGVLVDLRIADQVTDAFVEQEDIVERFMADIGKLADDIEKSVMEQVKAGKTKVKI